MGKKSRAKKERAQAGISKAVKQLKRKTNMAAYENDKGVTTFYNPVKRMLKEKPYKSEEAMSVLVTTVEKYNAFLTQLAEQEKEKRNGSNSNKNDSGTDSGAKEN